MIIKKNSLSLKYSARLLYLLFFLLFAFGTYQSFKLSEGKYIQITRYPDSLLRQANDEYKKGNGKAVTVKLNFCSKWYSSTRCNDELDSYNQIIKLVSKKLNLFNAVPKSNFEGRIKLLNEIFKLNKDSYFYEKKIESIRLDLTALKEQYITAIDLIHLNQINKAELLLKSINNDYPNYGDVQVLLSELGLFKKIRKIEANVTPYLFAIEELGIEKYLELIDRGIPKIIKEHSSSK